MEKISPADLLQFMKIKRLNLQGERAILLVCMGISLVIWLFVKMSKTYESKDYVKIEYKIPPGRRFLDTPPNRLFTHFSGLGWDLLSYSLFKRNRPIALTLSDKLAQEIQRDVLILKLEEQTGLKVLDINHNYLSVSLDSSASRLVPVELDTAIRISGNYNIRDSIQLSPSHVTVFGSAQLLSKIKQIKTERLDMVLPQQDFTKTLQLVNPQPGLVQLSATKVEAFIPIEEFTEKNFTVLVTAFNTTDSVQLLPFSASLTCVVGLSRYEALDPSDFMVVADFEGVQTVGGEANTVPLRVVRSPEWVKSVVVRPAAAEFLIVQ